MEKKYQIFISSTYKDLLDERNEVLQALLELDCIPVGMELFPAADDDQWTLIKRLIDDCDYYILIIGGRYGSLHPVEGISYTQMEYEYALKKGVPAIAFIHKNPEKIESGKTDRDPYLEEKLVSFKILVEKKLCKYWETASELGGIVSRSLIKLIKDKPRPGWIKSSYLPDEDTNATILELRKRIDLLNAELEQYQCESENNYKELAQENDSFYIAYSAVYWDINKRRDEKGQIVTTWNDIFSILSPFMVHEIEEEELKNIIKRYIINIKYPGRGEESLLSGVRIELDEDVFQTIKIQLRALNLIEQSDKKRSLKDTATYWTLTKKGEQLMVRLRAIYRDKNKNA